MMKVAACRGLSSSGLPLADDYNESTGDVHHGNVSMMIIVNNDLIL